MLGCILALQYWQQYLIGKWFDVLINYVPNQYILSQQKLSRRQVRWVEVLVEYAANFVYMPGHIHSAPDASSRIPILNTNRPYRPYPLLKAMRWAQNVSIDKEFLHFKNLVNNSTSDFSPNQGSFIKLCQDSLVVVILEDTRQLHQTILQELYTSPLVGHLG